MDSGAGGSMELTNEQVRELFESDPESTEFTDEELEAYFADHGPPQGDRDVWC
jgi:hypothetical protein